MLACAGAAQAARLDGTQPYRDPSPSPITPRRSPYDDSRAVVAHRQAALLLALDYDLLTSEEVTSRFAGRGRWLKSIAGLAVVLFKREAG